MVFLSSVVSDSNLVEEDSARYEDNSVNMTVYGTRWASEDIPKYSLPDGEMPPKVAYRLIDDELALDGIPSLNLASFVTTFMEDEAEKLMVENLSKNFIDFEEYPQTAEISNRCVNMIARLFHAPVGRSTEEALGCSTIGSSEAVILGTLAMKRRWQLGRKAKGLSTENPNIILGANCQVAWHKATRYLEIESREVPCTKDLLYMDPKKAVDLVDENTIGVCAILGSTYTGHYEDVKTLNRLLEEKNKATGLDVNIHVDAASGGFVAPFVTPDLEWDFRLNRVVSINASGHKYGLTYPGVGWAVWRNVEFLPKDLVFNVNYLGSEQASFTLNFSKSASQVIAQYYMFVRLGRKGFTRVISNLVRTADYLAERLDKTGRFIILSEKEGRGLPLVAFRLKNECYYDEFDLASHLRQRGWIVPAYTMAHTLEKMKLLRVVVREDFSHTRGSLLIRDIMAALQHLDSMDKASIDNSRSHRAKHRHSAFHKIRNNEKATSNINTSEDENYKEPKSAPGVC
ncbi:glutamate decarboxylase [Phycomyces blakesleeanus]